MGKRTIRNIQILKAAMMLSGIILIVAGVVMVFRDIQSEGTVSIVTPLVRGEVNATHVGLFAIVVGALLEVAAILKSYVFTKRETSITSPDLTVREKEEKQMTHPANKEYSE